MFINFFNSYALVIFNEDKSGTEGVNWEVDVSSESLDAFKDAIHGENYKEIFSAGNSAYIYQLDTKTAGK